MEEVNQEHALISPRFAKRKERAQRSDVGAFPKSWRERGFQFLIYSRVLLSCVQCLPVSLPGLEAAGCIVPSYSVRNSDVSVCKIPDSGAWLSRMICCACASRSLSANQPILSHSATLSVLSNRGPRV